MHDIECHVSRGVSSGSPDVIGVQRVQRHDRDENLKLYTAYDALQFLLTMTNRLLLFVVHIVLQEQICSRLVLVDAYISLLDVDGVGV